jgi:U-box domain
LHSASARGDGARGMASALVRAAHPSKPPLPPPAPYQRQHAAQPECALFETPEDLCCPITHEAFYHPVLTSSGQVYERAAIQRHLESSATDPLTGAVLASPALTPVYLLQSRAAEWREATCRACIEAACSLQVAAAGDDSLAARPARYLRRAAELAADGRLALPGLPREVCDYVAAHPAAAHDGLIMLAFGRGLQAAG